MGILNCTLTKPLNFFLFLYILIICSKRYSFMHVSICEIEVDNMDKSRNQKWVVPLFKGYIVWNYTTLPSSTNIGQYLISKFVNILIYRIRWKHTMVTPFWGLFGFSITTYACQNMLYLLLGFNFGVWALGLRFS